MPKYSYVAMDQHGKETKGTLEAASQNEAIGRIKEMQYFPTKIVEVDKAKEKAEKPGKAAAKPKAGKKGGAALNFQIKIPGLSGRVKTKVLTTFTRQLATLVDAGLPLLRGLRVLEKQEKNVNLKTVIAELALSIEGGSTFSEALAQHPKVFNRLFVNMVKAGELGGVLEVVLTRLSEFMEKAQKIKGKVISAMFYPVAVLIVATGILLILMTKVVPKFEEVFQGMAEGAQLPAFTRLVMGISHSIVDHFVVSVITIAVVVVCFLLFIRTKFGRHVWDKFKLKMPVVGPVISKVAISRFTRTLGTLVSSGVPILQALTIVKETAGNVIVSNAVSSVHESVKEGETITAPLEASGVFPPMVISMVDVGEQTGALPEMLLKIADNYDEEVETAVESLVSLLEPIMIVILGGIIGFIVIALFLPLITLISKLSGG
jgi:type IV pilus assembly protein PilC